MCSFSCPTVDHVEPGRRLEDPDDFVVLEITAALRRGIRVIPVLVDGAPPPRRGDLPEALEALARRQGLRLGPRRVRRARVAQLGGRLAVVSGGRDATVRTWDLAARAHS